MNSANQLLSLIRKKNCTFDSMFICGNLEFRKEVATAFKESDLTSRVKVVREIAVSVDSITVNTLNQLKQAIPNITEYIAEDTVYTEKLYMERL